MSLFQARLFKTLGSHLRQARLSSTVSHKPIIQIDFPGVVQPRADDSLVDIVFVNYAGIRKRVPAKVGGTLLDAAKGVKYEFLDGACGGGGRPLDHLHKEGSWYEPKYGEGAFCSNCHVIIPHSHFSALPPKRGDEVARLQDYPFPEDVTDTSRLACQVTITSDMHGMVVYVPDGPPSDLP